MITFRLRGIYSTPIVHGCHRNHFRARSKGAAFLNRVTRKRFHSPATSAPPDLPPKCTFFCAIDDMDRSIFRTWGGSAQPRRNDQKRGVLFGSKEGLGSAMQMIDCDCKKSRSSPTQHFHIFPSDVAMLGRRLRRWPNIATSLVEMSCGFLVPTFVKPFFAALQPGNTGQTLARCTAKLFQQKLV